MLKEKVVVLNMISISVQLLVGKGDSGGGKGGGGGVIFSSLAWCTKTVIIFLFGEEGQSKRFALVVVCNESCQSQPQS